MHSFYVRKLRTQLFCAYVLGLYFTGVTLLAQKLCVERWWNWPLDANPLKKFHIILLHHVRFNYCLGNWSNAQARIWRQFFSALNLFTRLSFVLTWVFSTKLTLNLRNKIKMKFFEVGTSAIQLKPWKWIETRRGRKFLRQNQWRFKFL
jgi:hypothetical protein